MNVRWSWIACAGAAGWMLSNPWVQAIVLGSISLWLLSAIGQELLYDLVLFIRPRYGAKLYELLVRFHPRFACLLCLNEQWCSLASGIPLAMHYRNTTLVQLMLDRKANPDGYVADPDFSPHVAPLTYAVFMNDPAMVRLLLDNRANIANHEPLAFAVSTGRTEIARLLLERGAPITSYSMNCAQNNKTMMDLLDEPSRVQLPPPAPPLDSIPFLRPS